MLARAFRFNILLDRTLKISCSKPRSKDFHDEFTNKKPLSKDDVKVPSGIQSKYKIFRDADSPVIFDVEEKKLQIESEMEEAADAEYYAGLNMNRGLHGVFDIEDLVETLKKENAEDIFVCSVPKELKYVDYMCVVTGRSLRHMSALVAFVRRVYKNKRHGYDIVPKIEGGNSKDWIAMDLGNIALHVFSPQARKTYDLESLWSIGSEYDKECNKKSEPILEMFEKHSIYLSDLKPEKIV